MAHGFRDNVCIVSVLTKAFTSDRCKNVPVQCPRPLVLRASFKNLDTIS